MTSISMRFVKDPRIHLSLNGRSGVRVGTLLHVFGFRVQNLSQKYDLDLRGENFYFFYGIRIYQSISIYRLQPSLTVSFVADEK
jgi:hypothetical protein